MGRWGVMHSGGTDGIVGGWVRSGKGGDKADGFERMLDSGGVEDGFLFVFL